MTNMRFRKFGTLINMLKLRNHVQNSLLLKTSFHLKTKNNNRDKLTETGPR